jgi:hypothetical protein
VDLLINSLSSGKVRYNILRPKSIKATVAQAIAGFAITSILFAPSAFPNTPGTPSSTAVFESAISKLIPFARYRANTG